jgi:hypothetical protein
MAPDEQHADRPILVTGGDSLFFPMIQEQHESIRAASPGPLPSLGVIDAGLTADEVRRLKASDVIVVRPQDIPDFPAEPLRKWSAIAVDLGKLWLDQLFPGHDIIVWLDGDTWVQDYDAIDGARGASQPWRRR